ncbi:MAG: TonB-dependent receptor [Acetobacteraceae bacterium]|nr:TonB-dependent receptor [Acetobacteraceae bacterium]
MRRFLFVSTALVAAFPVHAQSPAPQAQPVAGTTLAETIVTATRIPTPSDRVPASITVISRREIEERGYQTLAEALQFVPGLRMAQLGGIGQQATAFLRGNSGRSTLVLLDGVPINDPSEPNGAFNFGNETLFDIERIEILRGPASSMYGASAIGGVVNLVSRRAPRDRALGAFGEAAGGTQRTFRGGVGAGGTVGMFDYLGTVSNLSTEGFNALSNRFANTLRERDGYRGTAATARLGFNPNETTRIEALLRWRQANAGLDSVPRDDPNYSGEDRRWYGQLRAETTLLNGLWTTGLRIAATEDRRRYLNLRDQLSTATTYDLYRGTRLNFDWGNTVRLPSFGVFDNGAASFGVTHIREESFSRSINAFPTRVDARQDTTAGHASLQYRAFGRLDLTAALRHDSVGSFGGATTWRVGAVLQVPELNLRIRAAGGSGFNAPSLYQRFGTISGARPGSFIFQGNPNLRPEHSIGYEFGVEMDIPAFGNPRFATPGVTFFQSRVTDLINFNTNFSSLVNVDRAAIKGAELSLSLRPAPWLTGDVAWTITDATDARTNQPLARRPEHVVSVAARINPIPRLVVTPQLLFTGRSPETASYSNTGAFLGGLRYNKSGAIVNLTATYEVLPQVAVFAEARNLGGRRWEPANGFAYPGRSLLVGTRFTF